MLKDAEVFRELLALYRGAGGDAASYRRLGEALEGTAAELRAYFREVARDYLERLERRLGRPGSRLTAEECDLVRAWEGVRPFDARREQLLLDDLAALDLAMAEVTALRDRPLQPAHLDRLRRHLEDAARLIPGIERALAEKEASRRLEAELGDGAATLEREALLERLRRLLQAAD